MIAIEVEHPGRNYCDPGSLDAECETALLFHSRWEFDVGELIGLLIGMVDRGLQFVKLAFSCDSLVRLIHTLDAIFELPGTLRKLSGDGVRAARDVATGSWLKLHHLTNSKSVCRHGALHLAVESNPIRKRYQRQDLKPTANGGISMLSWLGASIGWAAPFRSW